MQHALVLKGEMVPVDGRLIERQPNMTRAIVLCQELGGVEDKQLVGPGGIVEHSAQWSRIKSGQHHFPQDHFGVLMDLCGNEAPLLWLARSRGYALVPLESEMERRLRLQHEENQKLQAENDLLRNLMIGRAAR